MEPLVDVTPYIAMIDKYLAMADPYFQGSFYNLVVIFGLLIPGTITFSQVLTMIFVFPLWASLFPVFGPVTFGGLGYFSVIWVRWRKALETMNQVEDEGDAAAAEADAAE